MHRPLLLRGARQLLTLRGPEGLRRGADCLDLSIINDGSVLIRDGTIVSIGQSRRVDNLAEARGAVVHEVHGAVVMPGFVDASAIIPDNATLSRRLFDLALAHGSTTIGGRGSYAVLRSLAAAPPVRASIVPTLEVGDEYNATQLVRAARLKRASGLRVGLSTHSRASLRFFQSLALAIRAYDGSPANPGWMSLALVYEAETLDIDAPLSDVERVLLAQSPACAILTPASAAGARKLIDAPAAVALGSGFGAPDGSTCSMQTAAVLAAREGCLDIAEAITLSTINAAHALGVASRCGSLETGKQADILVLHLSDYRDMTNYTGVNVISKIFQAGNLVP
jgi:hypothetical protein